MEMWKLIIPVIYKIWKHGCNMFSAVWWRTVGEKLVEMNSILADVILLQEFQVGDII
jgi:hypothetical protein